MKIFILLFLICLLSAAVAHADMKLPPDPGEAGRATLAGIDSDGDGVRDDIQRWIALTYPDSARLRSHLTQDAKIFQKWLLNSMDRDLTIQIFRKFLDSGTCKSYLRRVHFKTPTLRKKLRMASRHLEANFMNTDLRVRTYLSLEKHWLGIPVDGKSTRDNRDDYKLKCDFDPDTLPN